MTRQQAHQHALDAGAKVFKRVDTGSWIAYRRALSIVSAGGEPQWAMCAYALVDGEYHTSGEWLFCPEPE